MRFRHGRDSLVRALLFAWLPSQWNCQVCCWPRIDGRMEDSERGIFLLRVHFWKAEVDKLFKCRKQRNFRYWSCSHIFRVWEWKCKRQFWKELLEAHLRHPTPSWRKSKGFYTDLYLPANYVHEKRNQNEIQIFTKINPCFVSFLRHRCQNRVLSITDNSSDVCVCWWISWEALLLAQAVKRSHLYFNGLRSSGRMWRRATISQWKGGSYVAGNLFVRVFYPYKWN